MVLLEVPEAIMQSRRRGGLHRAQPNEFTVDCSTARRSAVAPVKPSGCLTVVDA